jgi:hypothetical protein
MQRKRLKVESDTKRIGLFCPPQLLAEISERGTVSEVIRESLERYYYLLARARAGLAGRFTAGELGLLCDLSNGTIWQAWSLDMSSAQVEDAGEASWDKWGVDSKALVAKLNGLSLVEHAALIDATERFWQANGTDAQSAIEKVLE